MGFQLPTSTGGRRISEPSTVLWSIGKFWWILQLILSGHSLLQTAKQSDCESKHQSDCSLAITLLPSLMQSKRYKIWFVYIYNTLFQDFHGKTFQAKPTQQNADLAIHWWRESRIHDMSSFHWFHFPFGPFSALVSLYFQTSERVFQTRKHVGSAPWRAMKSGTEIWSGLSIENLQLW